MFGGMRLCSPAHPIAAHEDEWGHFHFYDLHILDMDTMVWDVITPTSENWPTNRAFHSLTAISPTKALLYGGSGEGPGSGRKGGSCWLLNTEKYLSPGIEGELWTRCWHHERLGLHNGRLEHQAVREPGSSRVWIIGGRGWQSDHPLGPDRFTCQPSVILELTCTPPPLKVLASECVVKNMEKLASELKALPDTDPLRRYIEARARESGKYIIS